MNGSLEYFTGKDGKYYFHLKAGNGEIILGSQGYKSKQSCLAGMESVVENGKNEQAFEHHTANDGSPYFLLKADYGKIIGKSQMYSSFHSAQHGVESVMNHVSGASKIYRS